MWLALFMYARLIYLAYLAGSLDKSAQSFHIFPNTHSYDG